ncbi:hypothetical protein BJ138DRAFT_1118661 [Hygrophoropsis aurantiaca]|uniref:Uncharacterized protein n=1 Tax=Hygrophoropsis aurantiaca TaxID=72124 RepID=A0ACB7ZW91_9AGAM|nr:hypothetical protein BJ138DRAFT_1118661 [Hygrophoropsis aurantiaca]
MLITRFKNEKRLKQAALSMNIEPLFFVPTAKKLEDFLSLAKQRKALAHGIESLHVTLEGPKIPIPQLRELLALSSRKLSDLELVLPKLSKAGWSRLLQGLRLPHLSHIRTNAPHAALSELLLLHPQVQYLSVDSCDRAGRECILEAAPLPALSEMVGPLSCISSVINGRPLTRVSAKLDAGRSGAVAVPDFLRALSTSMAAVTNLQIPFPPRIRGILRHIADAAPALESLVLQETRSPLVRRASERRAWDNTNAWASDLWRMPRLTTLALLTHTSLIPHPGDAQEEERLVQEWVISNGHHHPSLRHLALCYHAGDEGEVISYWDLNDRVWIKAGGHNNANIDVPWLWG